MSAGKSMEIIKVAYNYEIQNKEVMVITSHLDNRFKEGHVWSRTGFSKRAFTFDEKTNLVELILKQEEIPVTVIIDEAQFLKKKQVLQLTKLTDEHNIIVMCYGLKNDSFNNLFEGSKALIEMADSIKELKTECWYCTRKALMNMRYDEEGNPVYKGDQIAVGGDSSYRPVCRVCYFEGKKFKKEPETKNRKNETP
jgi:thymidine kinase